jgi:hypothetical protein
MPSELWVNLTDAYLRLFAGAQILIPDLYWSYQLLCMPTFHSNAHLVIAAGPSQGVVAITWCDNQSAELFQAVRRHDTERLEQVIAEQRRQCRSELVLLGSEECMAIERQLSMLDPWSLMDVDLNVRDGIALRLICEHGERQADVHCSYPTRADAPAYFATTEVLLRIAHDQLQSESYRRYYAILQQYMSDLDSIPL